MITKSILLSSIPLLIDLYVKQYRDNDLSKTRVELANEVNHPNITSYDFIIVGGGTSGCVLAGRLSEQYSVLLLEAGGDPPPAVAVPYYADEVRKKSSINYCFKTVPMKGASLSSGGVLTVCTGKMLGGSGSHNQMIYNRGSPFDYDNWGKLTNDSSWSYNNVLKFFKKLENFTGERFGPQQDDQFYGDEGPIQVKLNNVPILPLWFQAAAELGFITKDPNGNQTESFTAIYKAVNSKGQRSSSYKEYVEPYESIRKNLKVIRYANVSKILLNENNKAYGVSYTRHERFSQIAYASKEVILCAGTFSSPLLLIKSGIGPVKTLKDAQIPVKVALEAVGKNLKEHPAVILQNFSVNDTSLFPRIFSNETEYIVKQYGQKGEGILATVANGPQCFKVSQNSESNYWPDLWLEMSPKIMADNESQKISFNVILGRPKSKGTLSLNTDAYKKGIRDDTQLALIDYKFFSNPIDVETMIEGIKLALKIVENTTAFQSLQMKYNSSPDQACTLHQFRSDDYWRCFIRQKTQKWTHMVGTCSMGPESGSSLSSVVDNRLRVRGVKNLRICDASVIPAVTNANLNTPVLMVAEKASDMILKDWSLE